MKMYSRMYGPSRSKGIWIYNQEVEPELFKLSIAGTDNVGNAVTGWVVVKFGKWFLRRKAKRVQLKPSLRRRSAGKKGKGDKA